MAVSVGLGILFVAADGLPHRFGGAVEEIRSIRKLVSFHWKPTYPCQFYLDDSDPLNLDQDLLDKCTQEGNVAYLFGDSHAFMISRALHERLKENSITLITFSKAACMPILGVKAEYFSNSVNQTCNQFKMAALEFMKDNPGPVILSSRWRLYVEGRRFNNQEGGVEDNGRSDGLYILTSSADQDLTAYITDFLKGLSQTRRIIVIDQIPEAGWSVPSLMIKRKSFRASDDALSTSFSLYLSENERIVDMMNKIGQFARVIKTADIVCDAESGRCINEIDGLPLYVDDDHPSPIFGDMIADEIIKVLQESDILE